VPREKNLKIRAKIIKLWERGMRSPSEIARELGLPVGRVRYYMWAMRREGILPSGDPHKDLLERALDELKGVIVLSSYLLAEFQGTRLEEKYGEKLRRLRDCAERANSYVAMYVRMRGLVRGVVR